MNGGVAWVHSAWTTFFPLLSHTRKDTKKERIINHRPHTLKTTMLHINFFFYLLYCRIFFTVSRFFAVSRQFSVSAPSVLCGFTSRGLKLNFLSLKIPKNRNETDRRRRRRSVASFVWLSHVLSATTLRPCLFLSLSLRNSVFLSFDFGVRNGRAHTCMQICLQIY